MQRRRSRIGEHGFTLLELLVVLAIAGLLSTLIAPRLTDSIAHARLRSSGDRIVLALRDTRSLAMKTAQPARLSIDPARRTYSAGANVVTLPYDQEMTFAPFGNLAVAHSPALVFLPDGGSSGGTITITHAGQTIHVDIDWLSGRVSLRDDRR